MASVLPAGPDPRATISWLSMLALEHGRAGTGAWLTGAAATGPAAKRRRRRSRAPVTADPPAAELDAAVEADSEPEAAERAAGTATTSEEVLAHCRQDLHEPPVPRLQALEWRPVKPSTTRAAESARRAVRAAERLARAKPLEAAAIGGSVLLLLLLRLTRRRRGHSPDVRGEPPASGGAQQAVTPHGGVFNADPTSRDDAPDADVGDGMLAPVLKGSALSVRENGQWLERVLMLRADHTLQARSLSPGAGAPASIPLHGAVASPVPGEPLCFTLDTADDCCLLLRCRTRHESDSWVQVLNAASLALGAPMLSSLVRTHGSHAHLVAAPAFGYCGSDGDSSEGSSLEEDGEMADGLMMSHLRYSPLHRGASGELRAQHQAPPPPIVRGVLVLARSVLTAVVAPVRISAALVILPFALVVHGAAATVGAVVGGGRLRHRAGSRQPGWRDQGAEDAEAAPEKQTLLQRFLTEDLDMSGHANGGDGEEEHRFE